MLRWKDLVMMVLEVVEVIVLVQHVRIVLASLNLFSYCFPLFYRFSLPSLLLIVLVHSFPFLPSFPSALCLDYMMNERGSPNKDGSARLPVDIRNLSDDQISVLEAYIAQEKVRRAKTTEQQQQQFFLQQQANASAIEARKNVRRSRSGGLETAFTSSRSSHHKTTTATMLKPSSSFIEQEDPEVRSAFSLFDHSSSSIHQPPSIVTLGVIAPAAHASSTSSSNHQSPAVNLATGRIPSRTNGAIIPSDKMFPSNYNTIGTIVSSSSPAAAMGTPSNIMTSTTVSHMTAVQQLSGNSPVSLEVSQHNSRSSSRSATANAFINREEGLGAAGSNNGHNNSFRVSIETAKKGTTSSTPGGGGMNEILANFSSIEHNTYEHDILLSSYHIKPQKKSSSSSSSSSASSSSSSALPPAVVAASYLKSNRDFVWSPSLSAFDDISVGSGKGSINSSRSSRTKNTYSYGMNEGILLPPGVIVISAPLEASPSSTFSKHHHNNSSSNVNHTHSVKKTIQTTPTNVSKAAKRN
jgi:hypothetical protein